MAGISELLKNKNTNSFFGNYVESKEIGAKIFESFKKIYVEGKGYPIDTIYNSDKFGVISNVMAFSTILELDSMDVNIESFHKEMFTILELILIDICPNGNFVYDASPCVFNSESKNIKINTYVETISKVIILFTDLRKYLIKKILKKATGKEKTAEKIQVNFNGHIITSYEELLVQVEKILIRSIKEIDSACLENKEKQSYTVNGKLVERALLSPEIKYRGWAFQAPGGKNSEEYDISIYFTYYATNAFLSIYEEFGEFFDFEFEKIPYETNLESAGTMIRKKFVKDKEFFESNLTTLKEFRERAISAGRYVDTVLRENNFNFAFDYVKSDLTPISVTEVLESQKNNYASNTLFVLALLINAGIDDDYNSVGQLDSFYDQVQYSLMNVKKIYSILKKNNKEDLVSSYRLTFSEKTPIEYKAMLQEFRKKCANIGLYDLLPLLFNTNSTISKYLIKYPQKEMVDNLDLIMDNRASEEVWLWDRDGFNVNNNLYYIFALENFYEYYEEFELPLSENGKEYNIMAKTAQEEKLEKIRDLALLRKEYELLKQEVENKKSNLDNEVYNIANKVFENSINDSIEKYFKDMINDYYRFLMKIQQMDVLPNNIFDNFGKSEILFKISFAAAFPKIINKIGDINSYADDDKKLIDIDRKIKDEILNLIESAKISG